jgi:hypothetical protein
MALSPFLRRLKGLPTELQLLILHVLVDNGFSGPQLLTFLQTSSIFANVFRLDAQRICRHFATTQLAPQLEELRLTTIKLTMSCAVGLVPDALPYCTDLPPYWLPEYAHDACDHLKLYYQLGYKVNQVCQMYALRTHRYVKALVPRNYWTGKMNRNLYQRAQNSACSVSTTAIHYNY